MTSRFQVDWRNLPTRFFHSWQAPALVGMVLLVIAAVWLMPRRVERVVPVDGSESWDARHAPPRRQVVWQSPAEISALAAHEQHQGADQSEVFTPRLADGGATLYYTRRDGREQADIHRARLVDGTWQAGGPVTQLNTTADEIGPVLARDGRELYFYSNRPGGLGGYDLYVSRRTASGWGPPQNLGPSVNTAAHEYDPAIAPDGRTLYFASNRTPDMSARAARAVAGSPDPATGPTEGLPGGAREASGDLRSPSGAGSGDPRTTQGQDTDWATTLRAHPGLTTFDLYASRRDLAVSEWQPAAAVAELNRGDTNEGAPFVAPNGAFLYFASDRPARTGEDRNLDLYRARRIDERFDEPENLGPSVNTAAHETEPALSPEGFTLVFSSNRAGGDRIYQSAAEEVYEVSEWDAARLSAIGRFWWLALLITLVLAALIAAFLYYRGRLFERAYAARFFLGSILVHLLLLFLLTIWTFPVVVEVITTKLFQAEPSTQLFDDNEHQSHEDGREAYEKLADLASPEKVPAPELVRQETSPQSVPERTDNPLPTIPESVARALPPKQVLFVPPARQEPVAPPQPQPEPLPLLRRSPTPLAQPLEVAEAPEELQLRPSAAPAETAVASRVELARQKDPAAAMAAPSQPVMSAPASAPPRPAAVELTANRPAADPPAPPQHAAPPLERSTRGRAIARAADPVDEPLVLAAAALPPNESEVAPSEAAVPRDAAAAESPAAPATKPVLTMQPGVAARPAAANAEPNQRATVADALKPAPATAAIPKTSRALPPVTVALAEEPAAPSSAESQVEVALAETEVALSRNQPPDVPFTAPAAKELTGPVTRDRHRIIIGVLSDARNDAPPAFDPHASVLDRRRARATRVAFAEDNVGMRSMFTLRQGDTRRQHIELFGGNEESEKAVNRGLEWLAAHQNADGSWSLNKFHENCNGKHPACTGAGGEASNCAATGLALLPFLAAGHTHLSGEHQKTVAGGLKWLVDHQKPDGDLLAPGDNQKMYSHGIAAIALCEAFGMSQDPELQAPAQRALDFIVKAQHGPSGGWRYGPNEAGDTSVVGWQMMALKSGEMAGLSVPHATLENAARFLAAVESKQPGGTFGYQGRNPTPAMTAEGLLCLQFLGTGRNTPRMLAGADYLLAHLPEPKQQLTSYYWYYATQVMYHMQGKYWEAWNEKFRNLLVESQVKDGHLAGTWNPSDQWENRGGRIYATSLKLLILEVYYRHLPLYEQLEE